MNRPRGPYAKTARRREEILQAALEAYAESDAAGPTIKDIARRAGLSEAGVLHHFGGREELLTAVVAERDEVDARAYADHFAPLVQHNMQTPGLVRLFTRIAAASVESDHPANEFFAARYARLRDEIGATGPGGGDDEDAWRARVMLAVVDGLQLQWLHDPSIDMAGDAVRLAEALGLALDEEAPADGTDEPDQTPGSAGPVSGGSPAAPGS
ncbi:transcriptional regulator, tetR family [Sanguibacter keddieii DSM 10542]|uniref:Transcriptional regulator, tetR family n=1 Tax=Sanguibacter keddieii (strain ATCC 51767 / DSM 10542 / NCFB 3025 / ST-74) TaxID=446469 RepID=D1BJI5_SANKS|nr:TetR/AcrR family transcriptional regulator [Sanguibacter keddieii]ACZ20241.1 transcriptional regulator, tetR family [Sanguibacter keddieii DSM 10542]